MGVEGPFLGRLAVPHAQGPHVPLAVVAEQVRTSESRDRRTPVDDAAGDRAALVVGVLEHRENTPVRVAAALEGMGGLHLVPAEVRAASAAGGRRQLVDLLPLALPDVADPQVA